MKSEFDYLADKIKDVKFESVPFKHITIHDFLSDEHFEKILK